MQEFSWVLTTVVFVLFEVGLFELTAIQIPSAKGFMDWGPSNDQWHWIKSILKSRSHLVSEIMALHSWHILYIMSSEINLIRQLGFSCSSAQAGRIDHQIFDKWEEEKWQFSLFIIKLIIRNGTFYE